MSKQTTGLRGVKAGNTAICTVGAEGHGLHYRGYAIEDLAENACFEEVVHLLLCGALPTQRELDALKTRLRAHRYLPDLVVRVLRALPAHAHPMDVLRTGVSALGIAEPEQGLEDGEAVALRLLGALPSMLGVWHLGPDVLDARADDHAGYLFSMLKRDAPSALECRMMDASLILYAEHEFNASTFAARVCASTLADFYGCITGAVGTLSGPLQRWGKRARNGIDRAVRDAQSRGNGGCARCWRAKNGLWGSGTGSIACETRAMRSSNTGRGGSARQRAT